MHELWQQILSVDLGARLRAVLTFVDSIDPCFLGLIVGLLVYIGSRMVTGQVALRSWGLRLAAATFLLYGGYTYFVNEVGNDARHLAGLGLKSACVSGAVLAFTWIVFPVAAFVFGHLRLVLATFLIYGGYVVVTTQDFSSEHLATVALRGSAVVAFVLLVAWIIDPVWNYVVNNILPRRAPQPAVVEQAPAPAAPAENTLTLPERPRRKITQLAPSYQEAETAPLLPNPEKESQRRREKARLQLELCYVQAMPAIATWFPRRMFDDFLNRYLGDHLPPEDVEENSRNLQDVLQQHQEQVRGQHDFESLEELVFWLLHEQQRIQAMALDQPFKQSQMLDLHQRYLVLATRMVQKQPLLPYTAG